MYLLNIDVRRQNLPPNLLFSEEYTIDGASWGNIFLTSMYFSSRADFQYDWQSHKVCQIYLQYQVEIQMRMIDNLDRKYFNYGLAKTIFRWTLHKPKTKYEEQEDRNVTTVYVYH